MVPLHRRAEGAALGIAGRVDDAVAPLGAAAVDGAVEIGHTQVVGLACEHVGVDRQAVAAGLDQRAGRALAGRAAIVSTDVADDYRYVVGTTTVAGLAGFGLDGFVTKHLSIGGELGAFAGQSFGRDKEIDEGDVEKGDEKVTTTILSSFTGLMITVWR